MKRANSAASATATGIRSLPSLGVDPELVQHGLELADLFASLAQYWSDAGQLAQVLRRYKENQDSGAPLLESFIRGALGDDLLNIYRDAKTEEERISRAMQAMDERKDALVRRADDLESRQAALRMRLTQRYQTEF